MSARTQIVDILKEIEGTAVHGALTGLMGEVLIFINDFPRLWTQIQNAVTVADPVERCRQLRQAALPYTEALNAGIFAHSMTYQCRGPRTKREVVGPRQYHHDPKARYVQTVLALMNVFWLFKQCPFRPMPMAGGCQKMVLNHA